MAKKTLDRRSQGSGAPARNFNFENGSGSYNEKLNSPGDLPKVEDLSDKPEAVKRMGGTRMLIAAPMQYHNIMAKIPDGKVITTDRVSTHLAKQFGADVTFPLTADISTNIRAHASEGTRQSATGGDDNKIPWWRTLKPT